MGFNFKKVLSYILIAQTIYAIVVLSAHIIAASYISDFWYGELTVHFLHYEMALLPFVIASLIFRKFKKSAVVFLVICGIAAFSMHRNSRPRASYTNVVNGYNNENILQVICYNGHTANSTKKEFVDWLKSHHRFSLPTLFVLIEASAEWRNELLSIEKDLPHHVLQLRDDNFGIYLASNLDLSKVQIEEFNYETIPAILGEVTFHKKKLAFAAVHPFPPISNYRYTEREVYLRSVKEWLNTKKLPSIVCGDFNTSPWSASYNRFTGGPTPLKDTFSGPLRPMTWGMLFLHTSIDFIFHSSDFETLYARTGPKLGSDHNSISTILRWK